MLGVLTKESISLPNGYVEKMYGIILCSFTEEVETFKNHIKKELMWRTELGEPFANLCLVFC